LANGRKAHPARIARVDVCVAQNNLGCGESRGRALGQPGCAQRLDRHWRSGSWVISPTLNFTETVTCHSDQRNSSLLSASRMTTRLNGGLSARIWFQIDNENNPKPGSENGDTVIFVKPIYNSLPAVDRRLRHSQTVVTHGETTT
jgi:hypothetical protein